MWVKNNDIGIYRCCESI